MTSGEKTGLALLALFGVVGLAITGKKVNVLNPQIPEGLTGQRRDLLTVALSQVGHVGGDKYWAEVQPALIGSKQDWCGGFVLWNLHQVQLATDREWIIGKGFILTPPFRLPVTSSPQPGDIIYIDQPSQHQGLLLRDKGYFIDTVDGNTHNTVDTHERKRSDVVFFSIEPLLAQGRLANA